MLKKRYQKIFITAILFMTVLSMLGMAVAAAVIDEYTVTFVYDDALCKSLVIKEDGVVLTPVTAGSKEYRVSSRHTRVTIEIVPATGYAVDSLKSEIRNNEDAPQISDCAMTVDPETNTYSYSAALDSTATTFTVAFSERKYTIQVEWGPEDSHRWPAGTTDPSGETYYYSTDENEYIALSIPVLSGYTFNGWMILPSQGAQTGTLLPYKSGEDHVKLYKNTVPKVGATLYLMPDWSAEEVNVYRLDYEYFTGSGTGLLLSKNEHGISWKAEVGSSLNGKMGEDITYPGYYPFEGEYAADKYYSPQIKVNFPPENDPYRNTVTRYYVPITYTLIYKGFEDDAEFAAYQKLEGFAATHVYNTATQIPQPQRVGYDFAGWQVYVGDVNITTLVNPEVTSTIKQLKLDSRQTYFAEGNTENEITLVATWTPKTYSITYDWNGIDPSLLTFDQSAYAQYVYDTALEIPVPLRKGYTLVGWELESGTIIKTLTPADGKVVLDAKTYTDNIKLKAVWRANTYTVTLNGNGMELTTKPFTVTFDTALTLPSDFVLPGQKGHTFLGFFTKDGDVWGTVAWIDADGKVSDKIWDIDGDTVLYAKWSVNTYQITVSVQDKTNTALGSDRVTVTVTDAATGLACDYLNQKIAYGTTLKIKIELAADFDHKIVKWNGEACEHAATIEFTYTVEDKDALLLAKALPVIATPDFTLDYVNEMLSFDTGNYKIVCDGVPFETTGRLTLREEFFGKTLQIIVFGVDGESANREMTLAVAARPEEPVLDDRDGVDEGEHIAEIIPTESTIVIGMLKSALEKYDFLYFCSVSDIVVSKDQWKPLTTDADGRFTVTELSPGTYYYVYICIKAKDGEYPQGRVLKYRLDTEATSFVEDTKQSLLDMIHPEIDDAFVQAVIDKAIADIDALTYPSTTFSDEVQAILNRVAAQLPIARAKDVNIAALNTLYEQLLATNAFDDTGKNTLTAIRDAAIEQIRSEATNTEAKAQSVSADAALAMKEVRVTYLYSGSNMLTYLSGLPQGTMLVLNAYGGYDHLIDRINDAIRLGMIASDGNGIPLQALQTLDLMAYYQLKLSDGEKTMTAPSGVYEIRLRIPESLRGNQGLQVAYYNEKTGMLTVLDTEIDGNDLVFRSNKSGITDFVILGDTTVIMTSFIAALGLTFLCQLIAIVILIVCRAKARKTAKTDKRYSFVLPLAMTIRFLPENSMLLLVVLGSLVVIAQIVLMYLLFTSDFVHRNVAKKRGYRQTKPEYEEKNDNATDLPTLSKDDAEPVEAVDADDVNDTSVMVVLTEEDTQEQPEDDFTAYEAAEDELLAAEDEYEPVEAFDELDADAEVLFDETDVTVGAYATEDEDILSVEGDGEVLESYVDYEDFIEPAANPKYSLPLDDDALYVDTATGEIYSADELNENDVILDDLDEAELDANDPQNEDADEAESNGEYEA